LGREWYLKRVTINIYLDIQNILNNKTPSSTYLIQELDDYGNPIIENPEDPADLQRYRMKELFTSAGTILPTVGGIIEF
jgi:hypothetical protein